MTRLNAAVMTALMTLLSSCWMGPTFYTAAQAERPLAEGRYKKVASFDPFAKQNPNPTAEDFADEQVKIAYAPDGRVIVNNGEGDDATITLVSLSGAPDVYVAQIELADPSGVLGNASIYGIVRVRGDSYRISLPKCDGTKRLAPGSNAYVKGLLFGRRTCSYNDRVTFETAMRAFAADPTSWDEYRLVRKKG
jgi:hypothetical protein